MHVYALDCVWGGIEDTGLFQISLQHPITNVPLLSTLGHHSRFGEALLFYFTQLCLSFSCFFFTHFPAILISPMNTLCSLSLRFFFFPRAKDCTVGEMCQIVQANKPKIGSKTDEVKVKHAYGVSQPTRRSWRFRIIITGEFALGLKVFFFKVLTLTPQGHQRVLALFNFFIDQVVCVLAVTLAVTLRASQTCAVIYTTWAFWVNEVSNVQHAKYQITPNGIQSYAKEERISHRHAHRISSMRHILLLIDGISVTLCLLVCLSYQFLPF